MYNDITFVTPYMYRNEQRHANFVWAQERLKKFYPGAEFVIGEYQGQPFCRTKAINNGVAKATRRIVIIFDSDFVFEKSLLDMALERFEDSNFTIPFNEVWDLTRDCTDKLLESNVDCDLFDVGITGHKHEHLAVGSIVMIEREKFYQCGGFDESTSGWGYDDNIFYHIAKTIMGEPSRICAQIFHLNHAYEIDYRNEENTRRNGQYYNKICQITDREKMLEYIKRR